MAAAEVAVEVVSAAAAAAAAPLAIVAASSMPEKRAPHRALLPSMYATTMFHRRRVLLLLAGGAAQVRKAAGAAVEAGMAAEAAGAAAVLPQHGRSPQPRRSSSPSFWLLKVWGASAVELSAAVVDRMAAEAAQSQEPLLEKAALTAVVWAELLPAEGPPVEEAVEAVEAAAGVLLLLRPSPAGGFRTAVEVAVSSCVSSGACSFC